LDGNAAGNPVAAGNRDRLARDWHQRVHQVGIHLAPHPRVHAAHGTAEHEAQVTHVETLGEHAVLGLDDVAVAVVRELGAQAVAHRGSTCATCASDRKSTRLNSSHSPTSYPPFS